MPKRLWLSVHRFVDLYSRTLLIFALVFCTSNYSPFLLSAKSHHQRQESYSFITGSMLLQNKLRNICWHTIKDRMQEKECYYWQIHGQTPFLLHAVFISVLCIFIFIWIHKSYHVPLAVIIKNMTDLKYFLMKSSNWLMQVPQFSSIWDNNHHQRHSGVCQHPRSGGKEVLCWVLGSGCRAESYLPWPRLPAFWLLPWHWPGLLQMQVGSYTSAVATLWHGLSRGPLFWCSL